jgi:hypothetical protein
MEENKTEKLHIEKWWMRRERESLLQYPITLCLGLDGGSGGGERESSANSTAIKPIVSISNAL